METTITGLKVANTQAGGTPAAVRFTEESDWVDSGGTEHLAGSYFDVPLTADGDDWAAEDFLVQTTSDAIVNQQAAYTVWLLDARGQRLRNGGVLAQGLPIPESLIMADRIQWAQLCLYIGSQLPFRDTSIYTRTETQQQIQLALQSSTTDASVTTKGLTKLSVAPVLASNPIAVGDNDSRMTNARTPTGSAGGDLAGTYPNPTVTQARGLRETGGTSLSISTIADGQYLRRSGTSLVGDTPVGGGGAASVPGSTRILLPAPNPASPGTLYHVTDEGNRVVIDTGYEWTEINDEIDVKWFGASGARTNASINTTFTRTSGSTSAGATSITVASGASFANNDIIKVTNAGPNGAVGRYRITAGGGTTSWTIYPPIHTAVSSGTTIHHGDNVPVAKLTATALAGAVSVTVDDASTFRAGHDVYVAGSGATSGGSRLHEIRTIQSVVGNVITLTSGITNALTASAWLMHDETRAINAAVAVCAMLHVGIIKFPRGTYMVNGTPAGFQNGRINLPSVDLDAAVSIVMRGTPRQISPFNAIYLNNTVGASGSIIQSDAYNGSIIAGNGPMYSNFTAVALYLENLTVRAYDNPQCIGVNAGLLTFYSHDNLYLDTGSQISAVTQSTYAYGWGVVTPSSGNGGEVYIGRTWAHGGWYAGLYISEHARAVGPINTFGNYIGVELGNAVHPILIDQVIASECAYPLQIDPTPVSKPIKFRVELLTVERRWTTSGLPSWLNTIYDINDIANNGAGVVNYAITEGSTSLDKSLLKMGGANITTQPFSSGLTVNFGGDFADALKDGLTNTRLWGIDSLIVDSGGEDAGTVVEQDGYLAIMPVADVNANRKIGYVTADTRDMVERLARVEVLQVASGLASTLLTIAHNANNLYSIYQQGGRMYFLRRADGSNTIIDAVTVINYNATNHRWWQLRSEGNVMYAEVSADGVTFTTLFQEGQYWPGLNQCRVSIEAGVDSSIASPGVAKFRNFRIQAV